MYHAKINYKNYYNELKKEDILDRLEWPIYILSIVGIIATIAVVSGSADYKMHLAGML